MDYIKLVRWFGIYHAIAIAPLMVPLLSAKVIEGLGLIHASLNLSGEWNTAAASEMLFINLFACVAFLWALVRIKHASRTLGFYEGWGMLAMSAIVIFYVLNGASALWLIVPLVDVPGGILHLNSCKNRDA